MKRFTALTLLYLSLSTTYSWAEKPNVLFLFADDMTFEAIGSLGLTEVKTPNLDKLGKRGTQFSHAYNMGAWGGAVCVASRSMLISGMSLHRAEKGVRNKDNGPSL